MGESRATAYYAGRAHVLADDEADDFLAFLYGDADPPDGSPPLLVVVNGGGESTPDRALLSTLPDEEVR